MILSEEAFNMIQSQLSRAIARYEKAEAALAAADLLRDRLDLYQPSSSLIAEYDALRDGKGEG